MAPAGSQVSQGHTLTPAKLEVFPSSRTPTSLGITKGARGGQKECKFKQAPLSSHLWHHHQASRTHQLRELLVQISQGCCSRSSLLDIPSPGCRHKLWTCCSPAKQMHRGRSREPGTPGTALGRLQSMQGCFPGFLCCCIHYCSICCLCAKMLPAKPSCVQGAVCDPPSETKTSQSPADATTHPAPDQLPDMTSAPEGPCFKQQNRNEPMALP